MISKGAAVRAEGFAKVSAANATDCERVYIECDSSFDADVTVYGCMGNASKKKMRLTEGVNAIGVKRSGLAVIERIR